MPDAQKVSRQEFASRVKARYPAYAHVPDEEVVRAMLEKYPQYRQMVEEYAITIPRKVEIKPPESREPTHGVFDPLMKGTFAPQTFLNLAQAAGQMFGDKTLEELEMSRENAIRSGDAERARWLDFRILNIKGLARTASDLTSPLNILMLGAGKYLKGAYSLLVSAPFLFQGVSAMTKPPQPEESPADILERRLGGAAQTGLSAVPVLEPFRGAPKPITAARELAQRTKARVAARIAGITPEKVTTELSDQQVAADNRLAAIDINLQTKQRLAEQANRRLAEISRRVGVARSEIARARILAAKAQEDALAALDVKREHLHQAIRQEQSQIRQQHALLREKVEAVREKYSPEKIREVQGLRSEAEFVQKNIQAKETEIRESFHKRYRELDQKIGKEAIEPYVENIRAIIEQYKLLPEQVPGELRRAMTTAKDADIVSGRHRGVPFDEAIEAMPPEVRQKIYQQLGMVGGPRRSFTVAQKHRSDIGRKMAKAGLSEPQRAALAEAYDVISVRMETAAELAGVGEEHALLNREYREFKQDFHNPDNGVADVLDATNSSEILRPFMGTKALDAMAVLKRRGISDSVLATLPRNAELSRMLRLESEIARVGTEKTVAEGISARLKPSEISRAEREPPMGRREEAFPLRLEEIKEQQRRVSERTITDTPKERQARNIISRLESQGKTATENREAILGALEELRGEKGKELASLPTSESVRAQLVDEFLKEEKSLGYVFAGVSRHGRLFLGLHTNWRRFKVWYARRLLQDPAIRQRVIRGER